MWQRQLYKFAYNVQHLQLCETRRTAFRKSSAASKYREYWYMHISLDYVTTHEYSFFFFFLPSKLPRILLQRTRTPWKTAVLSRLREQPIT
jgi:hypothetical protein